MVTNDAARALRAYLQAITFAEPIQHVLIEKYGISLADLRSLRILRDLGQVPISRFAEAVGIGRSTATGLVDRLEDREFVMRGPSDADRRIIMIALTPRGWTALDDCSLVEQSLIGQRIMALTPAQQRKFADLIDELIDQPAADE